LPSRLDRALDAFERQRHVDMQDLEFGERIVFTISFL